MHRIPDFEGNKTSWDYGSARKSRGMTGAGQITSAYRCDEKAGCNPRGGSGWKAAGWYLVPW